MRNQTKKKCAASASFLAAFALWTLAVSRIDVRAIGPEGSSVGFAAVNGAFHRLTGVHMLLYHLTDWLEVVPLGFVLGFALLGLAQLIRRKSLRKVDSGILVLGGYYALVLAVFLLFEVLAVNYRPVLIEGVLEASYPSSTTLLVLSVMPTAIRQLNQRLRRKRQRNLITRVLCAYTVFMVLARLLSGVHWLTDIIGGILLSIGLVLLYAAAIDLLVSDPR